MVDWTSPEELAREQVSDSKLIHVIAGIYLWEYAISLDFEWSFIRGRKRLNWPMIPYFLGRYLALGTIISGVVSANLFTSFSCQTLYTIIFVCAGSTTCLSSINLAIRTMVVWNMRWPCVVVLCLLSAGQWILAVLVVVKTRAAWYSISGCLLSHTPTREISALFLYSSCFDFIVLLLSAVRLLTVNATKRSKLANLLFQDGLIYVVVAVLGNIPAAVLALLQLNPLMSSIGCLPVNIISMIIATRAVRRLSNFSRSSPAIYMTTSSAPELSSLEPPKPIEIKVRSSTTTDASMSGDSLSSTGVGKRLFV